MSAGAVFDGLVSGSVFSSGEIILLAVFGGAMSFALMAASWLIFERGRITGENAELRERIAGLRAANERGEALVNVSDQRIVVWNGGEDGPAILGGLSKASGAPHDRAEFLAFGRWLSADSAISFEGALKRLRGDAEAFDLPLLTRSGGVLEAQGRTSGAYAFVRFVELGGERSMLSRLEAEHTRLLATFDTIQNLFERLPMPVWLRETTGGLYWTNKAYAKAVDQADGEAAVRDQVQLLDSAERRIVAAQEREQGYFQGALPAVVTGDRRMLDICEVHTEAGLAGIAIDRSEIEAVRATLKQTVEGHRQTLDLLATPIAIFDRHQKLQFHNSAFAAMWGLGEAFLSGRPNNAQVLDAFREERKLSERPDWRKWRDGQLEIYKELEPRQEFWHLADGQTVRVVVNPQKEGGVTWLFEDVTERLELESNYNALMRVQGETLDHLSEAVAVFGFDGKLKLCNPAFVSLWRLDEAQSGVGTHISVISRVCKARLGDPSAWDDIAGAITDFDEQRGGKNGRLETLDGHILDFGLVPLPDGQTMLTLTDMTAAVNVERALKEKNEALEQSDILKSRFIQHVSYELRAPLTSISGFSEMLGMDGIGRLNAKQSEYVGHISSAAGSLKSIIDDILDLATIDAGAMQLEVEPVALRPVVDSCLEELEDEIAAHGIRPRMEIARNADVLIGDPDRIHQILHNLLANAISVSPDGGAVTISSELADGGLEIAISDEGPGVPNEERERIFARFESRSAGNRRRGAGLGLSIVESFVQLHGGTIRVEDAEQRGARFVCRFPVDRKSGLKASEAA
ncbi:MAG: PAS-domain containing protein [Nitratireductor sp.]|nr:PAS-domain containing protein [Nitratireductor sp.]